MERRISAGTWMALVAAGMHEGWKNVAVAALPLFPAVGCSLAVALSLTMCAVGLWERRPVCGQAESGNRPGSAAQ